MCQKFCLLSLVPRVSLLVLRRSSSRTDLTSVFRWDLKGLVVLGKVSGGKSLPFGMPLDKRQWKYFSYTVSQHDLSRFSL